MKLDDLIAVIRPLPWIGLMRGQQETRYALHAANVFPELVETLRRVVEIDKAAMKELKAMGLANDVNMDLIEKCRIALARAEEVKEL